MNSIRIVGYIALGLLKNVYIAINSRVKQANQIFKFNTSSKFGKYTYQRDFERQCEQYIKKKNFIRNFVADSRKLDVGRTVFNNYKEFVIMNDDIHSDDVIKKNINEMNSYDIGNKCEEIQKNDPVILNIKNEINPAHKEIVGKAILSNEDCNAELYDGVDVRSNALLVCPINGSFKVNRCNNYQGDHQFVNFDKRNSIKEKCSEHSLRTNTSIDSYVCKCVECKYIRQSSDKSKQDKIIGLERLRDNDVNKCDCISCQNKKAYYKHIINDIIDRVNNNKEIIYSCRCIDCQLYLKVNGSAI